MLYVICSMLWFSMLTSGDTKSVRGAGFAEVARARAKAEAEARAKAEAEARATAIFHFRIQT